MWWPEACPAAFYSGHHGDVDKRRPAFLPPPFLSHSSVVISNVLTHTDVLWNTAPLLCRLLMDDQRRDENPDFFPAFSLQLLAQVRRGQKRLGRSTTIREQGSPIQSAWPDWERVTWRVPEHLGAMSVMPKRATWPPWAAALSVELD